MSHDSCRLIALLALLSLIPAAPAGAEPASAPRLASTSELSGWTATGRHEETVRLAAEFARAYPGRARKLTFGTTPEGREMVALVVSGDGTLSPAACRRRGRPVILFQGGIHSGEIDGKDAGFWALRDMLDGALAPGALDGVTVVFVPIFNIDGHERFGPNNRPNQTGPVEMGWRTTAQNLNLNRDYVKADAPEMRAMLGLLDEWDPAAYVDLHVTDGAHFQVDLGVMVDPAQAGPEPLATLARSVRSETIDRLTRGGWLATPFYPSFKDESNPIAGTSLGLFPARLSNGYWATRNRLGILVETHSWKDYPRRVRMTRDVIVALVEIAARDGAKWLAATAETDRSVSLLAGQKVTLAWANTEESHLIDFAGYAYERRPSAVSGAVMIEYDRSKPVTYQLPLFDQVKASLVIEAPAGGYLVPPAQAELVKPLLDVHGVAYRRIAAALPGLAVHAFRADTVSFAKEPFEGRFETKVTGSWAPETRDVRAGALFVPIAQPKARLVMTMFEPTCSDSLVAWDFFPTCFEKKEYMEPYVAEQAALEMMRANPALEEEFVKKLQSDAAFAASPAARLEFFYRRHPSFDERLNLTPVFRLAAPPKMSSEQN